MTATSDVLLNILATFLIPLFLGGPTGNNDPAIARAMAIEVLTSFRFQDACELLLSVQIVSFSLAAVGSIALSMAEDTSNTMLLRLRGNANNCNRSAETNRRALERLRNDNERFAQRQAEEQSDAAFHARYTDEQIQADIAENQRLAQEADVRLYQQQAKRDLAAAIEEMRDRERRLVAEEIAAGTLVPRPPVKAPDPSIETISLEDYLADPDAPMLINLAATAPRKPAETQARPADTRPAETQPNPAETHARPALTQAKPAEIQARLADTQPAPVEIQPLPASSLHRPAEAQSRAAASQPQPAAPQPQSAETTARPADSRPAPHEIQPRPANGQSQSAETQLRSAATERQPTEAQPLPGAKPQPAPASLPPLPDQEQQRRNAWANAMNQVAAEFASETFATPAESRANKIRIHALSSVARALLSGTPAEIAPPFQWPARHDAPSSQRKP